MMRFWYPTILAIACCLSSASAEDLRYTSEEELAAEFERRKMDVQRTRDRMFELSRKVSYAEKKLQLARWDGDAAEKAAIQRAGTLYKVARQGGSLRYLSKATSAVDFLGRLAALKRLMVDSLEARRQAGLRIAAAQKQLALLREEEDAASNMRRMLEEALAELENEKARRSGAGVPNFASLTEARASVTLR